MLRLRLHGRRLEIPDGCIFPLTRSWNFELRGLSSLPRVPSGASTLRRRPLYNEGVQSLLGPRSLRIGCVNLPLRKIGYARRSLSTCADDGTKRDARVTPVGSEDTGGLRQLGSSESTQDEDKDSLSRKSPRALIGQARRIVELARPESALIGGAIGLLLGTTSISLAVPKVMGELIDAVMQNTGGFLKEWLVKLVCTVLVTVTGDETGTGVGIGRCETPRPRSPQGTYSPLEAAGILMALFGCQSVMLSARVGLMAVAGERVAARLRKLAFGSMVQQETAFFDRNRTGDLVNRLASDVLLVQGSVTTSAAQGLKNLLMVFGCTGMLAYLSPQLAVVSVAVFPPAAGIGMWFGRRMKNQQKGVQAALAASSAVAEEVLSNIRTVRQFSAEIREKERYSGKVEDSYHLAARVGVTNAVFDGSMHFGGHASLCAVMALGGQQVASGQLSVGDMTSFLLYSTFLAVNFGGLTGVYSQVMRALGASERVMAIISSVDQPRSDKDVGRASSGATVDAGVDATAESLQSRGSSTLLSPSNLEIAGGAALGERVDGRVTFKDVHFSYPSRPHVPVLAGITLEVDAGSCLAIVGASGCGKSTVLRLMTRLYDPQAGFIELDGKPLHSLEPKGLRERVGVVEQEPVLFGGTIGDNIRYGNPEANQAEVEAASSVANASTFIESFPDGYDTQVGEGGIQMSGGQKQRIAIARAVLKDPAIMLLDEATSALDSESEHLVQAALEHVIHGRTAIIVAHRLSTVKNMADTICVLDRGQVVEIGTYDELARKPDGHFHRLVRYQMLA